MSGGREFAELAGVEGVYLVHLERPLGRSRHYLGWAADLAVRLRKHRAGRGSRLLAVALEAGIGWELARTWPGADRVFERRLKRRKEGPVLCPLCRVGALERARAELNARRLRRKGETT